MICHLKLFGFGQKYCLLSQRVKPEVAPFQCDQIGQFWKVLGDKYSHKCCLNIWCHFGLLRTV